MQNKLSKNPFIFLLAIAIAFWGLAIFGGIRSYSPIPYWDMWNGYLQFYITASTGDWNIWWTTHNEHRIILSRIFFWIDIFLFHGSMWFLIILNYIIIAFSCFIFYVALKEKIPQKHVTYGIFIAIWLISWSQKENITWGFQSQFFLAQTLPLTAFFLLHRHTTNINNDKYYFIGSCILGILSLGSMANGILVLPLMTAYAIINRLGWRKILILAALSCIGLIAYFHNYTPPPHHGSISSVLKENPLGLILYVLTYIGGPFYYIAKGKLGGIFLAQVAGCILILASAYISWISLRRPKKDSLELSFLFFILYIGGTAFGTASGRLIFGVDQALSSRYMTPSLMAWAALFVIITPKLAKLSEESGWKSWLLGSIFILAMLPMQLQAINSGGQEVFEKNLAGVAIALGANDHQQIGHVYYSSEHAIFLGKIASSQGLSLFSQPVYKAIPNTIAKQINENSKISLSCQGHIDSVEPIEGDNKYLRVHGWIFNQSENSSPKNITLIDENGIIIGYGLVGLPRPDVAQAVGKMASKSGFKGYVLGEAQGNPVSVFDSVHLCGFSSKIPPSHFSIFSGGDPKK